MRRKIAVAIGLLLVAMIGLVALVALDPFSVASTTVTQVRHALAGAMSRVRPIDDRERTGADDDFSVLLVVIDACRADKVGTYGFPKGTTPALDALAGDPDSVTFLNHYTQASWTKPSTASLFTGLYPHEHAAVLSTLATDEVGEDGTYITRGLSPDLTTLSEVLNADGYYTFGVVRISHLSPENGFGQGFDEFELVSYGGDEVALRKTTALAEAISGKFFGYVHLLGCHRPFPEEVRDEAYMAEHGFPYDEEARREAGIEFSEIDYDFDERLKSGETVLTEEDVRFLHLIYEARTRWTDRNVVQPLIEQLKASGRYDDTMLIITADHGEELYEHGGYGHGHALWNEVTHVPLIVKYPKGRKPEGLGARVEQATQSIDIAPSLIALTGAPTDRLWRGAAALAGSFSPHVFAEQADCGPENANTCHLNAKWALIREHHKLIEGDEAPLLFDLANDPSEQNPLTDADGQRVETMRAYVTKLKEASAAPSAAGADIEIDEDALRSLRGLGYVQ
jgi:arylsulfatase A-like enzyme